MPLLFSYNQIEQPDNKASQEQLEAIELKADERLDKAEQFSIDYFVNSLAPMLTLKDLVRLSLTNKALYKAIRRTRGTDFNNNILFLSAHYRALGAIQQKYPNNNIVKKITNGYYDLRYLARLNLSNQEKKIIGHLFLEISKTIFNESVLQLNLVGINTQIDQAPRHLIDLLGKVKDENALAYWIRNIGQVPNKLIEQKEEKQFFRKLARGFILLIILNISLFIASSGKHGNTMNPHNFDPAFRRLVKDMAKSDLLFDFYAVISDIMIPVIMASISIMLMNAHYDPIELAVELIGNLLDEAELEPESTNNIVIEVVEDEEEEDASESNDRNAANAQTDELGELQEPLLPPRPARNSP